MHHQATTTSTESQLKPLELRMELSCFSYESGGQRARRRRRGIRNFSIQRHVHFRAISYVRSTENDNFQQDNAWSHITRVTITYFKLMFFLVLRNLLTFLYRSGCVIFWYTVYLTRTTHIFKPSSNTWKNMGDYCSQLNSNNSLIKKIGFTQKQALANVWPDGHCRANEY